MEVKLSAFSCQLSAGQRPFTTSAESCKLRAHSQVPMRILNLVAGEKWTGPAAVVYDQTAALVAAGLEVQFGFVRDSPLAERLLPTGWARPLFERPPRWPGAYVRDVRRLRETILREKFDVVHAHTLHDHHVAAWAIAGTRVPLLRTLHHLRHAHPRVAERIVYSRTRGFAYANS